MRPMMTRLGQIHQRFAGSGFRRVRPGANVPATVGLCFWPAGGPIGGRGRGGTGRRRWERTVAAPLASVKAKARRHAERPQRAGAHAPAGGRPAGR
jgi:hypothetical protein